MRHDEDRGWWQKNWGYVVGCGCLTALLVPVACTALIWFGSTRFIKSTGAYAEAISLAEAHPEVAAELGRPIDMTVRGTDPGFQVKTSGDRMEMDVPVKGPDGRGRLRFVADRDGDDWRLLEAEISFEGRRGWIDLLADPPPAPE